MNAEIVREVNNRVSTRSADEPEPIRSVLVEEEGVLRFIDPDAKEPVPEVMSRGTSAEYLSDPWPWEHSADRVNSTYSNVDKTRGTYKVWASGGGGTSGQNYRGLAQFRTVKSGDKKFRGFARLPETSWYNSARAGLFGSSRTKTWSKIEV